jgi:hypothetical protein
MLVLLSLEHWRPDSATHTGTAGIKALEKEAGVEVKARRPLGRLQVLTHKK